MALNLNKNIEKSVNDLEKLKKELRLLSDIVKRIETFNSDIDVDQKLKEENFKKYKEQFFYELDNFEKDYGGKLQEIIETLYTERFGNLDGFFNKK